MNKTFNIDDMQNYFKNYVPCPYHKKQPITNFCTDMSCTKYLCPSCVEQHSKSHRNHIVQSIKTCLSRTRNRLQNTINLLQDQARANEFLKVQDHEPFTKKLIRELHEVRRVIVQQVQLYFKQKQAQIVSQNSKYSKTERSLHSLKGQLMQATKQLCSLKKGLFQPSKTVNIIQKANLIDYQVMVDHFKKQIKNIQKQLSFNIKLQMDRKKREDLRISLNDFMQMNPKKDKVIRKNQQFHDSLLGSPKEVSNKYHHYSQSVKKQFVLNPPPLSADRQFSRTSILIQYPNYFKTGEPFMHFFQVSNNNLHVMKIKGLQSNSPVKWETIPLQIDFNVPSFHKSIVTEQGVIYLIGGTDSQTMKKSHTIYEYGPGARILKSVSQLHHSRSSHTLVVYGGLIYVIGGMGDNDVLKECQVFNPSLNATQLIKSCKYATVNSCVCRVAEDKLLKLGGIFGNGQNNFHIQIYEISSNQWLQIDPVIEGVKGDFSLLSCSGWAPLTPNSVFVFGGYNQQADNQSSNSSYVIQYDWGQKQYSIKYINSKKLPIAEGFWSPQSLIYNNTIYALQNVDQGEDGQCVQNIRNILIFDGKYWKTLRFG